MFLYIDVETYIFIIYMLFTLQFVAFVYVVFKYIERVIIFL